MPPKNVKCSICGEYVSKRKTYLVDPETGARACKTHEGVEQKKDRLQEQYQEIKRRQARDMDPLPLRHHQEELDLRPKCFSCGKNGLVDADWWDRFIIAREKIMQTHGIHGFNLGSDPNAARIYGKLIRKAMIGPDGEEWHVNKINRIPDNQDDPKMRKLFSTFSRDAKEAARFMGIFAVCDDCMEKYGIEHQPSKADVSLKHMFILGHIMKPIIRDKALQEIRREAERN